MRLTNSVVASLLIFAVAGSFVSPQVSAQTYPTYSFSLSGTSIVSCWYWGVMFNAAEGQRFSVKWSETGGAPTSLDLYIVAPSSISQHWLCDTGPVDFYYNSGAFGSANWAAPSAGEIRRIAREQQLWLCFGHAIDSGGKCDSDSDLNWLWDGAATAPVPRQTIVRLVLTVSLTRRGTIGSA